MEFDTRKSKIIIASIFGALLFVGLIYIASIYIRMTPRIRYYFDVAFYQTKEFEAHVNGTVYSLPLPRGVAWYYRSSDVSCVYVTELTFEEMISWYEKKGYTVEGNCVYTKDSCFIFEDMSVDGSHSKRIIFEIKRYAS